MTLEVLPPPSDAPLARVPRTRLGYALVVGAATLFAINGTVSKVVLETGLDSLRLVEIRSTGVVVGLGAVLLVRSPRLMRVSVRELAFLAVYGVAGFALVQYLYFVAITRMPVSVGLLIEFTSPVYVALWLRFGRREAVHAHVWWALSLAVSGLVLVAQVWRGLTLDGLGVLAAFGAACSLAVYYLLGEHGVAHRDPWSLTWWAFVFASVFWAVLSPWWRFPFAALTRSGDLLGRLHGVHLPLWVLVAWVVVLGTIAPFVMVVSALRHLPPTRVGIVGMTEPVVAGLVAYAWLGESLAPVQIVGGLVVLAGIGLAQRAR